MKLKNITYEGAGIENVYSNESWLNCAEKLA